MTRSTLRLWASTGLLFVLIACAKAEGGGAIGDGDGDGDPGNSGGSVLSSSGGVVIGASGGASSGTGGVVINPMGGATSTGGMMNLGGAGTGGVASGTGGADFDGQCAGLGGLSSVVTIGDRRVYTCPTVQSNCPAEAVGVPALFECVSTHVPNCTGQTPDGATSWEYIGLCSETAMGGATN